MEAIYGSFDGMQGRLWRNIGALLQEDRALLTECSALLMDCWSLLIDNRALLMECRGSFDEMYGVHILFNIGALLQKDRALWIE